MYDKIMTGKLGEEIACTYLIEKCKCKILMRNFKSRNGEIDIIAKDKDEIVFVEVKTRNSLLYGLPSEAVDKNKQERMYKTAEYYLYKYNMLKYYCRFDVIEVYVGNGNFKINHLRNVKIDS